MKSSFINIWGFINARHSWFTRLQQLLLAHHFDIEHRVRCSRSLFFNFNGTAGMWLHSVIIDAGGWVSDTVTEDLDLSYRAQLKGWRFVYVADAVVPSELPVTLAAFRTQQQRWARGSIQTARKVLPELLRSGLQVPGDQHLTFLVYAAPAHLCLEPGDMDGRAVSGGLSHGICFCCGDGLRITPYTIAFIGQERLTIENRIKSLRQIGISMGIEVRTGDAAGALNVNRLIN